MPDSKNMKVLIVGGGAREHALAWRVSQSPLVSEVFCAPGNPGTSSFARNINIVATDIAKLAEWAANNSIDLTIVGPEMPLALGIVDLFYSLGLRIFGPNRCAARIESSKAFAKDVMNAANVKTPKWEVFTDYEEAKLYIENADMDLVVKADGLAAGKGVIVPSTKAEALVAVHDFLVTDKLGESGRTLILEERIIGREASVMAIVSGSLAVPLVISQDYKRIFDGDSGPNTGGMGAISPNPVLPDSMAVKIVQEMFVPVLEELKRRNVFYTGFLYGGLIIDDTDSASIIEFNCRLGDPEAEVIMMRLKSDLVPVILAACEGSEAEFWPNLEWSENAAACVVASSCGYPGVSRAGDKIESLFIGDETLQVFHAGTKFAQNSSDCNTVITAGGRVLCISALGNTVEEASKKVYSSLDRIKFEGIYYRKDIGSSSD